MTFSDLRAAALAERLPLDLDSAPVCLACLSFVSFALESGDARKVRLETRRVTQWLWDEGLALPLQVALEQARRAGVPDADAAVRDVVLNGAGGATARAVVRRLALDLIRRRDAGMAAEGLVPQAGTVGEDDAAPGTSLVLMRVDLPGRRCRGSPDDVA